MARDEGDGRVLRKLLGVAQPLPAAPSEPAPAVQPRPPPLPAPEPEPEPVPLPPPSVMDTRTPMERYQATRGGELLYLACKAGHAALIEWMLRQKVCGCDGMLIGLVSL